MIIRVACVLSLIASSATALSCLPATVGGSYQNAAEAKEPYVIVSGRFDFAVKDLPPRPVDNDNPPETLAPATFTGSIFNGRDFSQDWSSDITIKAQCFGPWCASMTPGTYALAFLEKRPDGYLLSLSPCGGAAFVNPTQAQLDMVVSCHIWDTCETGWDITE